MSDVICKSKTNSKLVCGHAKAYKYMYICVFFALKTKSNINNYLQISPLMEWPQVIVLFTTINGCLHRKGEDYLKGSVTKIFLPYIFK